jgi:hypothetical protein
VDALPAQARPPLDAFLRTGGRLLVLGRPPFEKWSLVSKDGREWESTRQFLDAVRPRTILADFSREDMSRWQRSTDNPQNITTREIVSGPDENTRALQVAIQQLSGWDTLGRTFERPFPKGHALTCFSAKGSRRTTGLIVEWREKDGSRWIANIPLTTRWKHCALAPADFPFWRDGSPANRGGPGDRLNPENAEHLSFGVARSHLGVEGPGQEFSIAAVGTAPDPTAGLDTSPLHIEAMSPWHKIYQTSAASIRPWSNEGGTGYNPVPLTEGHGGTRRLAGFQPVHPAASIRPSPNVTLSPSFSVFCRAGVPSPASSVILSPSPSVILSEAKNLIHPRITCAKNPIGILIDRDLHPSGYAGVWERAKAAYLSARQAGKPLIVKTAATGKTTADMPLVTVGNMPYNGCGPLRYANAEFNFLRIRNSRGEWQDVEDGAALTLTTALPVEVAVSVSNTGEATWVGWLRGGRGQVRLEIWREDGLPVMTCSNATNIARYAYTTIGAMFGLPPGPAQAVNFQMHIENVGPFGEKRTVRIIPVP